jgi:hypothetical protein
MLSLIDKNEKMKKGDRPLFIKKGEQSLFS